MGAQNFVSMGGLDVLVAPGNQTTAVVMLHGYGANAYDLSGLKNFPGPLSAATWYFPQAPLNLPMGYYEARAWFPIEMEHLQARGLGRDPFTTSTGLDHLELKVSAQKLAALLEQVAAQHSHRYSQIILGGFSQGGMVALEAILNNQLSVDGLLLFSTGPAAWHRWQYLLEKKTQLPWIFQSHGKQDPMLPFIHAQTLFEKLRTKSQRRQFVSFQGGHEIPPRIWQALNQFLAEAP